MTLKFCQHFVAEADYMTDNKSRFTLRIDPELLEKLGYVAEYEGRTKNRELEQLIKKRIREFEAEHGEIPET
jgi:hypothetical protein